MPRIWALQDAKNRLSEVVNRAEKDGPQTITRHGKKAAVVISVRDYQRMGPRSAGSLVRFLRESPLAGIDLDLERDKDEGREVDL
jgi:prevent-host-death family protein